jgi:hypothetical protein
MKKNFSLQASVEEMENCLRKDFEARKKEEEDRAGQKRGLAEIFLHRRLVLHGILGIILRFIVGFIFITD